MKTFGLIANLLMILMCVACGGKEDHYYPVKISDPNNTLVTNNGSSSGGGGFVYPNSKKLLDRAKNELAKMLKQSSSDLFEGLPAGWNQDRIAKIVSSVRYEPNKEAKREGHDLMFNYGEDDQGQYIEALKPFFYAYAVISSTYEDDEIRKTIKDVQRQLLHEAVHFLGYGVNGGNDDEADQLAINILNALYNDFLKCTTKESFPRISKKQDHIFSSLQWLSLSNTKLSEQFRLSWTIHRSLGIGTFNPFMSLNHPEVMTENIEFMQNNSEYGLKQIVHLREIHKLHLVDSWYSPDFEVVERNNNTVVLTNLLESRKSGSFTVLKKLHENDMTFDDSQNDKFDALKFKEQLIIKKISQNMFEGVFSFSGEYAVPNLDVLKYLKPSVTGSSDNPILPPFLEDVSLYDQLSTEPIKNTPVGIDLPLAIKITKEGKYEVLCERNLVPIDFFKN